MRADRFPSVLLALALVTTAPAAMTGFILPAAMAGPGPDAEQSSQAGDLKRQGITAFEAADYPRALDFLREALEQSPQDPQLHYLLGYYLHYLCYDSIPLPGFSRETSDQVLRHLERAVELDPGLGNAYYFLGAEYGARAREDLRRGDLEQARRQLVMAREAGGLPDWMIEFARNTLDSCLPAAILLLGGDADTNPVEYLQLVEGYRTDVTSIPAALLERPWFVELLARGVEQALPPVALGWTREQILDMHPYKWRRNKIVLPVRTSRGIDSLAWNIAPDLIREGRREMLSAGRAAWVEILRANGFERPVHFSLGCPSSYWAGLESHVRLSGFAYRLDPGGEPAAPSGGIETERSRGLILRVDRYKDLPTVLESDMPRVSGMLQNYRSCFLMLAAEDVRSGRLDEAREVIAIMDQALSEEVIPVPEGMRPALEGLRRAVFDVN